MSARNVGKVKSYPFSVAVIPLLFGILVYKDLKFVVTKIELFIGTKNAIYIYIYIYIYK